MESLESIEKLNNEFLKLNSNNYECVVEVSKLIYDLNPSSNQKKATELLTDLSGNKYSFSLKVNRWLNK